MFPSLPSPGPSVPFPTPLENIVELLLSVDAYTPVAAPSVVVAPLSIVVAPLPLVLDSISVTLVMVPSIADVLADSEVVSVISDAVVATPAPSVAVEGEAVRGEEVVTEGVFVSERVVVAPAWVEMGGVSGVVLVGISTGK